MVKRYEDERKHLNSIISKRQISTSQRFVLSIIAGMFIALAGVASMIPGVMIENASISRLSMALIFPAGLAMVLINETKLFTGKNLMIITVLDKKSTIKQMLKFWFVVYIGNFLGTMLVSGMFTLGHVYSMFDNKLAANVVSMATIKCNAPFVDSFIKAIFCNILVCFAVRMSMMTDKMASKIALSYLPIMVFVMCGLEHSIANMGFISGGLFIDMSYGNLGIDTAGLTWFNFLIGSMLPVTLGNTIGGCATGLACWYVDSNRA